MALTHSERTAKALVSIREAIERARKTWAEPETQKNWGQVQERFAENERFYAEKRRHELLRARGIQEVHWPHLDAPEPSQSMAELESWLACPPEQKGALLVLSGTFRAGKSFAASVAVHRLGGLVVQARDLSQASNFDEDYWAELRSAAALAIDDLGMEPRDEAGWFDQKFFALMDGRLANRRRTVITCNVPADAFMARYASGELERLRGRFEAWGRFRNITRR